MTSRSESPSPASSAALYEDAYWSQQGEFHPEHHRANVQRLHRRYPGHSLGTIDAIYRLACRIDFEIQERVGSSQLSRQARDELLDWLEDHFNGFPRATLLQAIERAESS
jgi:hypothetical protein